MAPPCCKSIQLYNKELKNHLFIRENMLWCRGMWVSFFDILSLYTQFYNDVYIQYVLELEETKLT